MEGVCCIVAGEAPALRLGVVVPWFPHLPTAADVGHQELWSTANQSGCMSAEKGWLLCAAPAVDDPEAEASVRLAGAEVIVVV